jgi:VIT1/CCC1 family predicted Fe2+/Mn2+ transporter
MGRVILCILVGVVVALAAKGRELAATVTLAVVQIVLFFTAAVAVIASGRDWFHWFLTMLSWNCLCAIAIVVGGAIVRTRRSAETVRPSNR